ncbi:MAG TPA: GNAT family N-acetyltransferase [Terriglobales bacterium]|nr:GNAT family N-acetyltransferase [Terriglobales bacterium]
MPQSLKPAEMSDVPALLELMREFYTDQEMKFSEEVAQAVLRDLITNPRLGRVFLFHAGGAPAGYCVLTFCFSLEFHGRFALLDELYVREPFRRRGFSREVIARAEAACKEEGIKALRLEVWVGNAIAKSLYQSCGFITEERNLMTKWLK